MSRKILVTGGAGFIGSHLTDRLISLGNIVLVIDNYATGRRDNLQEKPNLRIVEGTIADKKLVDDLFDDFKPELVVHAAASYKDPQNWEQDGLTNVVGTANVVQAAERLNVKRLIYFQTALCYGLKPLEQPITLDHPLLPDGSSYAITKTGGERFIKLSELDFVSFRLANAYGPRNISGPLPTFYHRLMNNKPCFVMDTRRDFIYIDDLIDVAMKALDGKGECGVYHVSSGSDYSIKELFDETVSELDIKLDKEVEERQRSPDDAFTILLDPSKTKADFNWEVSVPLKYGVSQAIRYYQKFGISETYTHLKIKQNKQ
jgi:UDP-glucose 4-epimerase